MTSTRTGESGATQLATHGATLTKEDKEDKEKRNINNIYNNKFNLIKSYNNYEQRDDIDFDKLYANGGGDTNE